MKGVVVVRDCVRVSVAAVSALVLLTLYVSNNMLIMLLTFLCYKHKSSAVSKLTVAG